MKSPELHRIGRVGWLRAAVLGCSLNRTDVTVSPEVRRQPK